MIPLQMSRNWAARFVGGLGFPLSAVLSVRIVGRRLPLAPLSVSPRGCPMHHIESDFLLLLQLEI